MITTNEAQTALFKLLNVPEVKAAITGTVQKGKRKTVANGNQKQDVVIKTLSTVPGGLQEGYINVNIHVPDTQVEINGVNQSLPDNASIDRITHVVIPLIDDVMADNILFWITKITTFENAELKEHYQNLTVRFGHPNY